VTIVHRIILESNNKQGNRYGMNETACRDDLISFCLEKRRYAGCTANFQGEGASNNKNQDKRIKLMEQKNRMKVEKILLK